jgi:hypothetical protein
VGDGLLRAMHAREVHDRRQNRGEAMLKSGPRHSNGRRRFEYSSNSNEFKLLQNLPKFDRSKNSLY